MTEACIPMANLRDHTHFSSGASWKQPGGHNTQNDDDDGGTQQGHQDRRDNRLRLLRKRGKERLRIDGRTDGFYMLRKSNTL